MTDAVQCTAASQRRLPARPPCVPVSQIAAFVVGARRSGLPETTLRFADGAAEFGPESFSVLQRAVKEEAGGAVSLRLALALLRLSDWDPDVMLKFKGVLIEKGAAAAATSEKVGLRLALPLRRRTPAVIAHC